jgi:16S rRNA (adenine1518-N6/adenine1519-N6)-dimethyltransferase
LSVVQRLSEIKSLLAERGLRPRKRFGQNFLHDQNLLGKLVDAADVQPGDLTLEIGPGTGTLTEALLDRGADVIACELDEGLADLIESRLGDRVRLIRGDCLGRGRSLSPAIVEALDGRPFVLIANLPYQIASPLMVELLLNHPACGGQWITIQEEVADRLLADPGTSQWGPLGIIVQWAGEVKRLASLPPSCFWPEPGVSSAMVAIRPHPRPRTPTRSGDIDPTSFARFVTTLFTTRRKQLGGVLGRDCVQRAGIDPQLRCERLGVAELEALYRSGQGTGRNQ